MRSCARRFDRVALAIVARPRSRRQLLALGAYRVIAQRLDPIGCFGFWRDVWECADFQAGHYRSPTAVYDVGPYEARARSHMHSRFAEYADALTEQLLGPAATAWRSHQAWTAEGELALQVLGERRGESPVSASSAPAGDDIPF